MTEPVGFLALDDQPNHEKFEFGPGCIAYSKQNILFMIPTKQGWVEINQSSKIDQPLTLKLINKSPQNEDEKLDLSPYTDQQQRFGNQESYFIYIPEDFPYLDKPEEILYQDPNFLACQQIDENNMVITGENT